MSKQIEETFKFEFSSKDSAYVTARNFNSHRVSVAGKDQSMTTEQMKRFGLFLVECADGGIKKLLKLKPISHETPNISPPSYHNKL